MALYYVLDEAGQPCESTPTDWAKWAERNYARAAPRLAYTVVVPGTTPAAPEVFVSTVFLGINHQFGDGPPILWETKVFGGPLNEKQWRYETRAAALAGHYELVRCAFQAAGAGVRGTSGSVVWDEALLPPEQEPPRVGVLCEKLELD